jgi:hypothetical protein
MKVLFVAADSADYTAAILWDGLRSALGWQNVYGMRDYHSLNNRNELGEYDAHLHRWTGTYYSSDTRVRCKYHTPQPGEDDFDLLIGVTSFLRQEVWAYLDHQRQARLKKGGKVVWVDTLDAANEIFNPPFPVDAVFKREIDPAIQYPYGHQPLPLIASAPERWFCDFDYQKENDVFSVQMARSDPRRWDVCPQVFRTRHRGVSLAGSGGIYPAATYVAVMKTFKLCVIAPGGGGQCDTPRQAEAIACGSIPVFCAMPSRIHEAHHPSGASLHWFSHDEIFWVPTVEELPEALDNALDADLTAMRQRLKVRALRDHTSEARAKQFLAMIECDAWKDEKWSF